LQHRRDNQHTAIVSGGGHAAVKCFWSWGFITRKATPYLATYLIISLFSLGLVAIGLSGCDDDGRLESLQRHFLQHTIPTNITSSRLPLYPCFSEPNNSINNNLQQPQQQRQQSSDESEILLLLLKREGGVN